MSVSSSSLCCHCKCTLCFGGFIFKTFVVLFAITAVAVVVLAFLLKKDVDEIREFTQSIKDDLYPEKA